MYVVYSPNRCDYNGSPFDKHLLIAVFNKRGYKSLGTLKS